MDKNKLIAIGKVLKANRKTGELTISLRTETGNISENTGIIFLEIDGGPVPFFPFKISATSTSLRLYLEDYDQPHQALHFVGCPVYIEKENISKNSDQPHNPDDFRGLTVVDETQGAIGEVAEVIESTMQIILLVKNQNKEILIPLVREFVRFFDPKSRILYLDLPEGLIDLN
jgi:16S rRNA processing protein RimM